MDSKSMEEQPEQPLLQLGLEGKNILIICHSRKLTAPPNNMITPVSCILIVNKHE